MIITSALFDAFLKCPTKCFLLSVGEAGLENTYADWLREQNKSCREAGISRLRSETLSNECVTSPKADELKAGKWRLALDIQARTETVEAHVHALERISPKVRGKLVQWAPIRFIPNNKFSEEDKVLLGFDSFALSEMLGRKMSFGKIIHGNHQSTVKVKTAAFALEARKLTEKVTALVGSASPPNLALNRHCGECEFQARCKQKAIEKDDLSLLSNMTEKERKKLNSEGIFTVTQLSYTFRPRRRPRRLRDRREKYHHALKALAIREKKIHIVGAPELKIEGTPVYLDVEGLPDCDFYYLIGLRIKSDDAVVQRSFWTDEVPGEKEAWSDFLAAIAAIEKPVLIHYGSFETTFLKRMSERYGEPAEGSPAAQVFKSAINLVSFIFAQIYFPTYSNGLKDIGTWLGSKWSSANASGAQSIIWRMNWQASDDPSIKQSLITYNSEDCQALQNLTEALAQICGPDHRLDLENGADPRAVLAESSASKDTLWPRFSSAIDSFEAINKAARWDIQREKVYVRTDTLLKRISKSRKTIDKRATRINSKKVLDGDEVCSSCGKKSSFIRSHEKTIYDIRFSRYGIRRWVVSYRFACSWCRRCHKYYGTPSAFKPWGVYGRNLAMFIVYQTIDLCMPQRTVGQNLNRLFGMGMEEGSVHRLKARAAQYFTDTRARILEKLIEGNLIHADETPIVLKHKRGYVWVFTGFHEVAYFHTETREGNFVEQALKQFKGVLVSDFYAPYDSLHCLQQKCLIHLIRDLNDAVLDHPYDDELKDLVIGFGDLLRAIVQTIDRWGLKRRFLKKHLTKVDRFFRKTKKTSYRSEAALKWKERFEKNRNGLFTFLSHDGVPWNNNNAEHAIKAFARLRRAIVGLSTAKGIDEYLVLLSICQTCKYSGLDFLEFLLSGEKDIDIFAQKAVKGERVLGNPF